MPRLPSGMVVDIVYERARYHALQRRLRVTQRTPHHRLYALIDVVYPDPETNPTQWSTCYTFTGHTLDDRRWLAKWRAEDRAAFLAWIQQPEQVREIEHARRRLLAEPTQRAPEALRYPYPEQFYSELYRRIRDLPMPKATPEQWLATLKRMTHDGLREEELAWSGLPEYLKAQQRRGTPRIWRDELCARIDFSAIKVELVNELVPPRRAGIDWQERCALLDTAALAHLGLPPARRAVIRLCGPVHHPGHGRHYCIGQYHALGERPGSAPSWFVLDPFGSLVPGREGRLQPSRQAAVALAERHARRNHRLAPPSARPASHYDYVTLAGGGDYREWLVTLPHYQRHHFTGHYLERNLLLHMRTKERIDHAGRRLLFIEEMQSDWHQAGARYGYDNRFDGRIPHAPYRKEWVALGLKLLLMHVAERGLDGLAWATGALQSARYGRLMPPIVRLYDQTIPHHLGRLTAPWGVACGLTTIDSLDPWLQAWRKGERWYVKSADGRFVTRARLDRAAAKALIARHSRAVTLEVPLLLLAPALRAQIRADGLPLFGDRLVPLT